MSSLVFRLYALLMWLGQPLLRRKLARRSWQESGYGVAVEERFGRYSQPPEAASELLWVHAVSLGETRTAAALLKALRAQHPGLRILLTHGTATGRAEGLALLQPGDVQVWQPWDTPAVVARFFDHFKPRLGLLMETEVWPCVVAEARARALPLVLVNGRLSDKSLRQARRWSLLSGPAYRGLSRVLAQTQEDAVRFRMLGAEVGGIFGNLKFDASVSAEQQAMGKAWRLALPQPVLMFASSRDGEEADFFREITALIEDARAQAAMESIVDKPTSLWRSPPPQALPKFLVVPRHPQRFEQVAALAEQHGLRVSRRSGWSAGPAESEQAMQADVWLGDSLGEMALYYALSDVALLGGSFAPLGGQNLIEAAACACPVVMGPHTFNFSEAANQAESAGAALRVSSLAQAVLTGLLMTRDRKAQARAAAAGLAFAARNRGATARTLAALQPLLQGITVVKR